MLAAIEQDGQPAEISWPYSNVVPTTWLPPANIGQVFRARGSELVGGISDIRSLLDKDRPVLVVMNVSDAFYFRIDNDGVVDATEPLDASRVHALIAVGHGTRGTTHLTLVRNSWGNGWGIAGYAWLSDAYLSPRMIKYATIV
jgi:hypothetical protein